MRKQDDRPHAVEKWWGKLLVAVIAFGIAIATFQYLDMVEETGGYVAWPVALLYYIGGKWTAALTFALVGVLFTWSGVRQLLNPDKRPTDKSPWIG